MTQPSSRLPVPASEALIARPSVLLFSQAFPPDPAAVGQHMRDLARELAERGHRVVVYAAQREYDDATTIHSRHELTDAGVEVWRFRCASFGKGSLLRRMLAALSFSAQTLYTIIRVRHVAGVVVSTSPPLVGAFAAAGCVLRGTPLAYWAMDLNPDQLIALGMLRPHGRIAGSLERLNRFVLRQSRVVVALDKFMADRLRQRGSHRGNIVVIPPWSPIETAPTVPRSKNPFHVTHGLSDATVVMYSGNHSLSNPLHTLVEAAVRLRDDSNLRFVLIESGAGMHDIQQVIHRNHPRNVLVLPYQPFETLGTSLSAANVHVVSLGNEMTGIIHPSKVYGAMAVGRPVLYFGPARSHIASLLQDHSFGWRLAHGDIAGTVPLLKDLAGRPRDELDAIGARGLTALNAALGPTSLPRRLCEVIEAGLALPLHA